MTLGDWIFLGCGVAMMAVIGLIDWWCHKNGLGEPENWEW